MSQRRIQCHTFSREEIYRYLIDDFLIGYSKKLQPKDFTAKTEMFNEKKGKRIYLNKTKTNELTNWLEPTKGTHGVHSKSTQLLPK